MEKASSQICLCLFDQFHEAGIRYCHWKSNINLTASFAGDTDFDLLVHREDREKATALIEQSGFKRRSNSADKSYPGMEDFLGLDLECRNLIHLHVHYQLIIGKKYQKHFSLPLTDQFLNSAKFHDQFPIKVPPPELEYILLLVRVLLKTGIGPKSILKMLLSRNVLPSNIVGEFKDLVPRLNTEALKGYLVKIFPEHQSFFITFSQYWNSRWPLTDFLRNRRRLLSRLNSFNAYLPHDRKRISQMRMMAAANGVRWLGGGGCTIAIVGADGAGKSSTTEVIEKWLSNKISCKSIYMGMPRSEPGIQRLSRLAGYCRRLGFHSLAEYYTRRRWIAAAKIRYERYLTGQQLKQQGYVVLFERYPMQQFWEMDQPMDGPRLNPSTADGERERSYYRKIREADFTILLQVDMEDSQQRKPEHLDEVLSDQIQQKIQAVNFLAQDNTSTHVAFDTGAGQQKTLRNIKEFLWKVL